MLGNYLKITLRNIKKHKGYSFINIFGLAVGLSVFILIMLYVKYELSYDRYHKNADRIYRITTDRLRGGALRKISGVSTPAGPAFAENIPEIETYTRVLNQLGLGRNNAIITYNENKFEEQGMILADETFFKIFSYEFACGDHETALIEPGSVVITETTARRLFGKSEPTGQVIQLGGLSLISGAFKVTGVIKDVPKNSHFRFNYVFPYMSLTSHFRNRLNNWLSNPFKTYILIQNDTNIKQLENKINHVYKQIKGDYSAVPDTEKNFYLQKLTDIHLKSHLEEELEANSDIAYVYSFSIIAIFILLIAYANFINLMTARSVERIREVGIRKVLGATKARLIKQFISESVIFSLLGLLLALLIIRLLMPAFNNLTGLDLSMNWFGNISVLVHIILIVLITGILSGSYPAFFLSSYQPVKTLKGKSSRDLKSQFLRKALIVFQFSVSVFLVAGTLIILNQMNFMKNRNLGFKKEQILVIKLKEISTSQKCETVKNEFKKNPNVIAAAASMSVPGARIGEFWFRPEGFKKNETQRMKVLYVDYDFMPMYKMEIESGRNFSKEFGTDSMEACLINETAAKLIGWDEKEIGKKIHTVYNNEITETSTLIGIVKDFHYESLNKIIEPMIIFIRDSRYNLYISLKIRTENLPETISFLKNKTKEFEPGRNFEYFFLDEFYNRQYRTEEKTGNIFFYFTVLAIFIACLGLFGLASFIAEQSRKEISIRKVLGASFRNVLYQFFNRLIIFVLIANIIAWPITYFIINKFWLLNFPYRININVWIFLLSGVISVFIAILSISYHSIKSAIANPVDSLKYE